MVSWLGLGAARAVGRDRALRLFGELLRDVPQAPSLGRRYLDSRPGAEAEVRRLSEWLLRSGARSRGDLARKLEFRRQRDFERDRVVFLEGWVLAETEAQVCVLATFFRDSS